MSLSEKPLPARPRVPGVRPELLWDVTGVDGAAHGDFVVARALGFGTVDDIRDLRRRLGDAALREHLARTRGRRIDRRRLRYLEAILGLDRVAVEAWLADPARRLWDAR